MFSSMVSDEKVTIKGFYGRPGAWGAIIRTIKGRSDHFTCMTTFGHRIAAVCDDGAVDVYDSVTGVLRLSLNPEEPVTAIRGSPDGSLLFCSHKGPSITLWDIQTGGPIHTFALERKVGDIAVSSAGRHLACGWSNGSVKIFEIATKMEGAVIECGLPTGRLCWLEPEAQLVVARKPSADIWDITTNKVLRRFPIQDPTYDPVYSSKLNKLAIITTGTIWGSTVTIIDLGMGTTVTSSSLQRLSCSAFYPITNSFVCGRGIPGMELFDLSEGRWREVCDLAMITSISTLPNGTVVASAAGSGIQLLSLGEGRAPSKRLNDSGLTAQAFDEGRVIAILSDNSDRFVLLESATMSPLLAVPTWAAHAVDRTRVLCASLEHRKVVCCVETMGGRELQLWSFSRGLWTLTSTETVELPLHGCILPDGNYLVTLHAVGSGGALTVWEFSFLRLLHRGRQLVGRHRFTRVLGIRFFSPTAFHMYHDTHRLSYYISEETPHPSTPYHEKVALMTQYAVDGGREWVVSGPKRTLWIPPGYIRAGQAGYHWSGSVLIMDGEDEIGRAHV